MIQKLSIPPYQVKDYSCITINAQDVFNNFPFLSIDRDSYLVGVEVQSGINFDPAGGTVSPLERAAPWLNPSHL